MRWYLDTSVALHAVMPGGVGRAREWVIEACSDGEVFSSTLLHLEMTRVLRREGLDPAAAQPVIDRVELVSIGDGVLRFAAAIGPHIKTLDSIHLATCALLGSGVELVTNDAGMRKVAEVMGIDSIDPLAAL